MNYGIKEIKNIKFYNAKTREELKGETFTEKTKEEVAKDLEKQLKKKMLQKTTGYADPCLCPHCNKYYEGYNTSYNVDGEFRCENCIKDEPKMKLVPHFVTNIPSYCDGAICNVFTFKDTTDFYEKIKNRLSKGCILVKSTDDYYIME